MTTSTQTQLRRGTASQCDAMTPVAGEVIVDTTNDRPRLGDGARTGGFPIPNFSDIQNQTFTAVDPGGTGDAITITLPYTPLAWTKYMRGSFIAGAANTLTNPTLGITGLSGTKTFKKKTATGPGALAVGDIQAGIAYSWIFDGTYVQIESIDVAPQTGLTLLKTLTAAGGASMSFTGLMSSAYAAYELHLENFVPSVNTRALNLYASINNGSTWLNSGSPYAGSWESGFGSASGSFGNGIILGDTVGNASGNGFNAIIRMNGMMSSTMNKSLSWNSAILTASNGTSGNGFAIIINTSPVNALQLAFTTGNITSGVGRLYGFAP